MAQRGKVPKPTALHVLRGSSAQYKRGPEPKTDGKKPRAPTWLRTKEQRLFRKLATQMHAMGIIGTVDATELATYCRWFFRWLELEEFLQDNGQTYVKRGKPTEAEPQGPILEVRVFPHAKEARALGGRLLQLGREFGMTPASRARFAIEFGRDEQPTGASDDKSRFLAG